jgi:hypothetical protein
MPGVFIIQEARIIRRDGYRKRSDMSQHGMALVFGKPENAIKGLDIADPVAELPLPVVPLFVGDVRIETLSEGLGS